MSQRFFRSDAATYEAVRLQLDAAWGHPNNVAETCIEPVATAPRDAGGMVVLAVQGDFCEWPAVAAMLPQLLASGVVQEITREQYEEAATSRRRMP